MIPIGPAPVMRTSSPRTGKLERGVHGVAERVEDRRHVEVYPGQVTPHVHGREGNVLRERPGVIDPDPLGSGTLHTAARDAVAAPPADQMALPAHEVAYLEVVHIDTELDDPADELVADDKRNGHVRLGPGVP